jgi:tripartite-type tricarboxylate transporter receptor subunit TctC
MIRTTLTRTAVAAALAAAFAAPALAAWEPTKPVEFIVPAGTGGGADQMARFPAKTSSPGTT